MLRRNAWGLFLGLALSLAGCGGEGAADADKPPEPTKEELAARELETHLEGVSALAFSPDATRLYAATFNEPNKETEILVWDLKRGKLLD